MPQQAIILYFNHVKQYCLMLGDILLHVYDIERDGLIAAWPAVKDEILIGPSIPTVTELSVSRMSKS